MQRQIWKGDYDTLAEKKKKKKKLGAHVSKLRGSILQSKCLHRTRKRKARGKERKKDLAELLAQQ